MLTIAEGAGRPPVVLEVPNATLQLVGAQPAAADRGPLRRTAGAPLELAGTAGSFDGWMRGLPGNIDVQGGFGGGKIAIKGGVGVKGTTVQITVRGAGYRGLRPLYPPAGAGAAVLTC